MQSGFYIDYIEKNDTDTHILHADTEQLCQRKTSRKNLSL